MFSADKAGRNREPAAGLVTWMSPDPFVRPTREFLVLSASYSISYFAHNRSSVAAFTALCVAVCVATALAPRRRAAWLATGIALAAVLSLTLPPVGGWHELLDASWNWSGAVSALHPTRAALSAWRYGTDGPLNVALFVPLGASLTVLSRRPLTTLVACVALSAAIELYQAASGLRVGSASDVVSNGLGALLGACLGGAVLLAMSLGTSLTSGDRARITSR